MDFELSDDDRALQEGVRSLCEGRLPMEAVRGLEASGGVDRDRWQDLAETGVFSLRMSEDDGGAGLAMTEAVLVFEELGRALVPGPLVGTHLAAGLVDGAAAGDAVVSGVDLRADPLLVEWLDASDSVLAVDDDGIWQVDVADIDAAPVASIDPLTPLHHVTSMPRGDRVADAERAARFSLEGAALVSALLLGIAEVALDSATAYAGERRQFDRPIGSFQAVKHLLADMVCSAEVARSAVYAAGVTLDDPSVGDVERAVAVAKLCAGRAAVANSRGSVQVHGGMGFTWEIDAHLHLKRAWILDSAFGSADDQAERVAALL